MKVDVQLTDKNNAYVIKNLLPLYLYDLSGHYDRLPNAHGIYEENDDCRTLSEQYDVQNIWWEKPPGVLFPYLNLVNGIPAGFIRVATPPYCNNGIEYFVNKLFLIRSLRGQRIAELSATMVFQQFRGNLELFTNPSAQNVV